MSIILDFEKKLGDFHLKVDLQGGDEVISLLGASGCGKSMTLKCIAGIERPDRGRIEVDDVTLFDSDKRINLSVQQRRTGLLFQNFALFPGMTVEQNIYAGTVRYKSKAERKARTREIMEKFDLASLSRHLPSQLSGGQQQRTALARILVSDPQILMLDEPFSALDSHLRFRMEQETDRIIRRFGKTVILVSHDRDEVFRLSDRIAVMNQGKVDVYDERDKVFADPKTRSACMMTGCKNISPIRKLGTRRVLAVDWGLELETEKDVADAAYIGIRHHDTNGRRDIKRRDIKQDKTCNTFHCVVTGVIENPFSYTVMLRLADQPQLLSFGWELSREKWGEIKSDRLEIHIPPEVIMLLKE